MNLGEIILVLFIMFVLALTSSLTSQSRDEAELARDVAVVRDVALRYVNFKCSNLPSTLPPTLPPILPPTAVTLTRAATELGIDCPGPTPGPVARPVNSAARMDRDCHGAPVSDRSQYLAVGLFAGYLAGCSPNGPGPSAHLP